MSSSDMTIIYQMATINLFKIGGSIILILGNLGGILNLCVFTQKSLRQKPGSIYFIAFCISNFLVLWFGLFPFTFSYIFNIDLSISHLIYCRFRTYTLNVSIILPESYLILGSIDRILITSRNALIRQRSTYHLAFLSISIITMIWLLFYIPIWFYTEIQSPVPGVKICFFNPGFYALFMSYSTMLIVGILPPLLMTIFGFITWKNLQRIRIYPITSDHNTTNLSSRDHQLTRMLLLEICIAIIFSLSGSILYIYTQVTANINTSLEHQALNYFLLSFSVNLVFIRACLSSYSNFIISKVFRKNCRKILVKYFLSYCHQRFNEINTLQITARGTILRMRPITTMN
ncbi:unnamed protein product [Rotaria sordida]|uniref:G-protein coupled receptors family 1 profile domain-containing protein n=1 Tax=Rotaria sordida TaxID=392033 RepID=A0A815DAU1_9BILA|nr:unnamed protein product [Rotaria sordida]CAF3815013.1 unnamed protein product [Rotaria sordida]